MNAREAAYLSLLSSLRHEKFVIDVLEEWQQHEHPPVLDFAFAYEIAAGSARMALALDFIAAHLSTHQKLTLKLKERALLRTAIYQYYFMNKVPIYAIVDETIKLAKKYCHRTFANYLNALLRKMTEAAHVLPEGNSIDEISTRYSYPALFVESLMEGYGIETVLNILTEGNKSPVTMVRVRTNDDSIKFPSWAHHKNPCVGVLAKGMSLNEVAKSSKYYIQNVTPAVLISELAARTPSPDNILDLCASPGGKLLAAHDCFTKARLFANDVSEDKILNLSQNVNKYGLLVQMSCGLGEEYVGDEKFDLVILDVPCSNTGVLNKRPEARWRLTKESLNDLKRIQLALLKRATEIISEKGMIWYLTCSILKEENENLINEFCKKHGFKCSYMRTILPNFEGWDGGFGCLIQP